MKSFLHFLGQVNSENYCVLEGDACCVDKEGCSGGLTEKELVLWHLTPDMTILSDETAFARRVSELICALPETGMLALYWENPFSVHAFCGGFRGSDMTEDVPDANKARLSYANMKRMLDENVASGGQIRWFYPYPDNSFVTQIFSDERLPGPGECEENDDNFDAARLESFDEKHVTDALVQGGLYPQLAGSYLVVLSRKAASMLPDYARFSVQRAEKRRIVTKLYPDHVEKAAFDAKAAGHVLAMEEQKEALCALVAGMTVCNAPLVINEMLSADRHTGSVSFSFAGGRSLEALLDEMLWQGQGQKVCEILLAFCRDMRNRADRPFVDSEAFRAVFGDGLHEKAEWENRPCLPVTDIDLVCQNILISDAQATVIDYEWTFAFPIPVDFFVYRFLYLYLEAKDRSPFDREQTNLLYEKAGISPEERILFEQMETHFQQYVQEGGYVRRNVFEREGKPVLRTGAIDSLLASMDGKSLSVKYLQDADAVSTKQQTQLLQGSQAETCFLNGNCREGGKRHFVIPAKGKRMELELPGFGTESVMLRIGMLKRIKGESMPCMCETNGVLLGGLVFLFDQTPVLTVSDLTGQEDCLLLEVEEIRCSQEAASEIRRNVHDLAFLLENREQQLTQMKESASWKLTAPLRRLKGQE